MEEEEEHMCRDGCLSMWRGEEEEEHTCRWLLEYKGQDRKKEEQTRRDGCSSMWRGEEEEELNAVSEAYWWWLRHKGSKAA